ncbi:MAG TPA: 50S ribosomal protein L19, partial [Paracoccaceae bacterium]|nr:50S ribosomal protein L19 [Paracoccaceae bacterium]
MNLIAQIEAEQIAALAKTIPDFRAGDTLRVGYKVKEGNRSRVQAYEGVCIGRNGGDGIGASFT